MLEKLRSQKKLQIKILIFIVILTIVGLNFYYQLGYEYSQPTADLWINRAYRFALAFRTGDYAGTYVFYHPGVTISWLVGTVVWYFPKYQSIRYGVIYDPLDQKIFSEFNSLALIPIVTTALVSIIFLTFLFYKKLNYKIALTFLFFAITENFFIGNIRSIHMDAFVSIFLFASFVCYSYFLFLKGKLLKLSLFLISALFFALSVLTRSNSFIYLPFFVLINIVYVIQGRLFIPKQIIKIILNMALFALASYLFMIILWPALWMNPIQPIIRMLNEGVFTTGLGDDTKSRLIYINDLPNESIINKLIHYPLIFLFRTNGGFVWASIITIAIYTYQKFRMKKEFLINIKDSYNLENFILVLCPLFIIFYMGIISVPDKMIFRYILPIYPFLFLMVAILIHKISLKWNAKTYIPFLGTLSVLILIESFATFPNSLTYYNRYIGGIYTSSKTVNTDQAGAGLAVVANDLNTDPQNDGKSVAVYDSVPFSQFYSGGVKPLKTFNKTDKLVNTGYVVLGLQNADEYFDKNSPNYSFVKSYRFGLMEEWYLYKKIN